MQTSADFRTRSRIAPEPRRFAGFFYAFQNIEENVRHQLQTLRTHPWIPEKVSVRGSFYD